MPRALVKREVEVEVTDPRDYAMARLLAARASAQAALDAIDECAMLFVTPSEDKTGKKREEMFEAAELALGEASRAIEAASGEHGWGSMDKDDVKTSEEDVTEDREEEEEEDDEEEDEEDEEEEP